MLQKRRAELAASPGALNPKASPQTGAAEAPSDTTGAAAAAEQMPDEQHANLGAAAHAATPNSKSSPPSKDGSNSTHVATPIELNGAARAPISPISNDSMDTRPMASPATATDTVRATATDSQGAGTTPLYEGIDGSDGSAAARSSGGITSAGIPSDASDKGGMRAGPVPPRGGACHSAMAGVLRRLRMEQTDGT